MKKLIIVEDDKITQQFYSLLFKKAGIETYITDSGDDLIAQLKVNNVGLVIMDVNLKNTYLNGEKMDGVSLSRHIKTSDDLKKVPVILATGYSVTQKNNNLMQESLAEEMLTKPIFDLKAFVEKVNKILTN